MAAPSYPALTPLGPGTTTLREHPQMQSVCPVELVDFAEADMESAGCAVADKALFGGPALHGACRDGVVPGSFGCGNQNQGHAFTVLAGDVSCRMR